MKGPIRIVLFFLLIGCSNSGTDAIAEMQIIEPLMEEDPLPELSGNFVDGAHPTEGMAVINSERTKLELTAFKTDAGPLLEFYLAKELDGLDYISLGELQGIEGDFTYDLPENINFETYKNLLVWCVDFKVSFGHAVME
jgi:hypothetical protein